MKRKEIIKIEQVEEKSFRKAMYLLLLTKI